MYRTRNATPDFKHHNPSAALILLLPRRTPTLLLLSERADQIEQIILFLLGFRGGSGSSGGIVLALLGLLFRRLGVRLALDGRVGIPAATELGAEGSEPAGLVLLDVHQLAGRRVPEETVARVAGGAVDGGGRGGAVREGAAVGQRDELREGVGPLGPAQQRGVSALRADESRRGLDTGGGGRRAAEGRGERHEADSRGSWSRRGGSGNVGKGNCTETGEWIGRMAGVGAFLAEKFGGSEMHLCKRCPARLF